MRQHRREAGAELLEFLEKPPPLDRPLDPNRDAQGAHEPLAPPEPSINSSVPEQSTVPILRSPSPVSL